jgi:hypothetical protein
MASARGTTRHSMARRLPDTELDTEWDIEMDCGFPGLRTRAWDTRSQAMAV